MNSPKRIPIAVVILVCGLLLPLALQSTALCSDWNKINTNGFGNKGNTDVGSMAVYDSKLFVGIHSDSSFGGKGCQIWARSASSNWSKTCEDGFGLDLDAASAMAVYNSKLYAAAQSYTYGNGCYVLRYDGGITWTLVSNEGFNGDFNNARAMVAYNSKLYVGTSNGKVWAYDGKNWTQVNVAGFGVYGNMDITCLAVCDGRLYAGTHNFNGCHQVWRYEGGTAWTKVCEDGFGTKHGYTVTSLVSYGSVLYAGTDYLSQVWRYDGGTAWTRVSDDGFGDEHNREASSLTVYRSRLYVGTKNPNGCQVWCYQGGRTWTRIGGNGFGDIRNRNASVAVPFGSRLYIGTYNYNDGCQVWSYEHGKTWYLAEGSTAWGFDTYISIANPNSTAVDAAVTYLTPAGPETGPRLRLPAESQTTVFPRQTLGEADFSTTVDCLTAGRSIAVDRTMTWRGDHATSDEAHSSVGVTQPSLEWYLPEGSSAWGFECWILIQNPDTKNTANCSLTYMIEEEGAESYGVEIPPGSRQSFNMAEDIGERDASVKVESDIPVIAERAMYRNDRREGHGSIGTSSPASDYYLAEGCTGFGFTTYILVQNPHGSVTDVTITYMTGAGPVEMPTFQMEANTRKTINVNSTTRLPDPNFSTHVHGTQPIIAERAMYWNGGADGLEVCHDSIGIDSTKASFFMPDGQTSNGRETWTLVQNPNARDVSVEITYLTASGQGNVVKLEMIPANSRRTFNMAEHSGIKGRVGVRAISKTAGSNIIVERAMYWDRRGAGTDTIGGYSD